MLLELIIIQLNYHPDGSILQAFPAEEQLRAEQ